MVWQSEIDELERRKRVASEMGGAERIAYRQFGPRLPADGVSIRRVGIDPDRGRSRGGLPEGHRGLTRPGCEASRTRRADEQVPLALPCGRVLRHREDHRPQRDSAVPCDAR